MHNTLLPLVATLAVQMPVAMAVSTAPALQETNLDRGVAREIAGDAMSGLFSVRGLRISNYAVLIESES